MSTVYIRFTARAAGASQRTPVLERLLARASPARRGAAWRDEAFRVIAGSEAIPAVASAALCGADTVEAGSAAVPAVASTALYGPGARPAWVCVATPLHLVAGMKDVMLPEDGVLVLPSSEAAALASDFTHVFGDGGTRLVTGRDGVLLCVFERPLEVETRDPDDMLGSDVFGFQAGGADAPRLRGLMSEVEMWLFDHAVNRARAARGMAAVSSLWLWGGGPVLAALPRVHGWTAGRDPLFSAFGDSPRFPGAESPVAAASAGASETRARSGSVAAAGAEAGAEVGADAGRIAGADAAKATAARTVARAERGHVLSAGVVVCADRPGSTTWPDVERDWLAPAMAALRAGRIECLTLSTGGLRFEVDKRSGWRFWRRPRPWWESFESERG